MLLMEMPLGQRLAFSMVGAIAKSQFIHLGHHRQGPFGGLRTALRQQGKLRNLGAGEEHGRGIGAGGHAGAAADAGRGVHGQIGDVPGHRQGVGFRGLAGIHRNDSRQP